MLVQGVIVFGGEPETSSDAGLDTLWRVLSWTLIIVAITGAFTMLFQRCPLEQLEAVRVGRSVPQDAEKVAESEPWARQAVHARR